jgi:FKBP-type peptidyl-prolyl cis-trans isomerase FklB
MKRLVLSLLVAVVVTSPLAAQAPTTPGTPAAPPAPKTVKDQASYSIGLNIGRNLKSDGLDVNPAMLARGIVDALTGAKPALSDADVAAALKAFQQMMEESRSKQGDAAKKEGVDFLAANAKKPDVKTLPSGLQYKVLKAGNGPSPVATDTVKTHYHGTFLNGEVFDSSVERGEPIEFPVNGVIKGWTEALQLMKVGDKWQLFIPSDLAYGPEGQGPIPPNSVLVFEVELLGVSK